MLWNLGTISLYNYTREYRQIDGICYRYLPTTSVQSTVDENPIEMNKAFGNGDVEVKGLTYDGRICQNPLT